MADRLAIDVADENEHKFHELARTLGVLFYHPTMKDLDWPALMSEYGELAATARTRDEFEHVGDEACSAS